MDDLRAQGYDLRALTLQDAPALAAAYARNREHLAPWDPPRPDGWWSEAGQRGRVEAEVDAVENGRLAVWVVHHDDQVVGRIALNNIVMAAF